MIYLSTSGRLLAGVVTVGDAPDVAFVSCGEREEQSRGPTILKISPVDDHR
jgi:hypothetical protein